MNPEELFLRHLPAIEKIAAFVCRPNRLPEADVEDFVSGVKLALIEDDYAIIRKFEGRSSFTTYLTTVIHRLLSQHRTKAWGRWRPSAEARRMGDVAITLERLTTRDGYSTREAVQLMTTGADPAATAAELEAISLRLPPRQPRPMLLSDETSAEGIAAGDDPEENAREGEREATARTAARILDGALSRFDPEEQLILRQRFWQARSVAEIAAALHLDQKKTYKRIDKLLARLRVELERAGVSRRDVDGLIMPQGEPLPIAGPGRENVPAGLSTAVTGKYGDGGKGGS